MSENGTGVFDSESLKASFKVGGTVVEMKPITISNLKRVISVVTGALDQFSKVDSKADINNLADILLVNYVDILKVLFPIKIMTDKFIRDNIDIPTARRMVEKAIEINSLTDLYPFLKNMIKKGEQSKIGA